MLDRRKKLPFISDGLGQEPPSPLCMKRRPPKLWRGFPVRRQTQTALLALFFSSSSSSPFCAQDVAFALRSSRIGCKKKQVGEREQNRSTNTGRTVQSESRFNWTAFLCDPRRLRQYFWLPRRRQRRRRLKKTNDLDLPPSHAFAVLQNFL